MDSQRSYVPVASPRRISNSFVTHPDIAVSDKEWYLLSFQVLSQSQQ